MNRFRSLLVMVAALAAMTACASSAAATIPGASVAPSPSPTPNIGSFDPCTLVTAAEASAASGKPLVNIISLGGPSVPGACIYRGASKGAAVFLYAQIFPDSATAKAVTPSQFESAMSSVLVASTSDTKSVSGVGDRATEFAIKGDDGQGYAIVVFRANVVFLVAVTPSKDPATVEGLARTAVSRLH